jgi:hypothetical protein
MTRLPLGRCPAADDDDPRPCNSRPDLVSIVDPNGDSRAGCCRHGAQLLASVRDAVVYPLQGDDRDALRCAEESLTRSPRDFT